ncbi:NADH dehydrogenase [ubiquinone] 1 beta subcomplex subunit 3 [Xylocopa sonorina]|uniref:NADH dehydrogenase [ubiquinone] 1 beta subcomplex subunit 3 n=1 Tax=Xylocopa sonorina TaxID=1818115 RepID=UPI00403B0B40
MGGHRPIPCKIPSPDIYKVENVPQLLKCQQKLAEIGLKDPWLRNMVWHYHEKSMFRRALRHLRGIPSGVGFFLITIAVENYFGISYEPRHDEDH